MRSAGSVSRPAAAIAAALLLAATAAIGGPRAEAGAGAPLLPDLVTLSIHGDELLVAHERGHVVLRLANEIGNRGDGPLEIFPSVASSDCDGDGGPSNDRDASQRVFEDTNASGVFERGVDAVASERRFGCVRYHPAHEHWHVLRSARYELRREPRGGLVASSRKLGFCHGDNRLAFPGPGTPAEPLYPFGSLAPRRCDASATQGISVGYADVYALDLPGQQLRIDDLSAGRYCLVSRADPDGLLEEVDERNNVRRTLIRLRPGSLGVRRLPGSCRN